MNPKSIEQWKKNLSKHRVSWKGIVLNPKGRPPKQMSVVLEKLRKEWFVRPSKAEILEICEYMIVMDEKTLKAVACAPSSSMFMRIIGKALLDGLRTFEGYRGMEMLDKIMERAYGKIYGESGQWEQDPSGGGAEPRVTINVIQINDRKDSPGFTGVASVSQELHEQKED